MMQGQAENIFYPEGRHLCAFNYSMSIEKNLTRQRPWCFFKDQDVFNEFLLQNAFFRFGF